MQDSKGRFMKGHHWRKPKPHWDRDWLKHEYEVLQKSTGEIAAQAGCTDSNIIYWMNKHRIPRRSIEEARAIKHWGASGADNPMYGQTGDANPRYVDGSSPERQRMYVSSEGRQFLHNARLRDGYKCRRCGVGKTGKRSLHVHHIKPWAGNPNRRFDLDNVVTLCRDCHHWVHSSDNKDGEWIDG